MDGLIRRHPFLSANKKHVLPRRSQSALAYLLTRAWCSTISWTKISEIIPFISSFKLPPTQVVCPAWWGMNSLGNGGLAHFLQNRCHPTKLEVSSGVSRRLVPSVVSSRKTQSIEKLDFSFHLFFIPRLLWYSCPSVWLRLSLYTL